MAAADKYTTYADAPELGETAPTLDSVEYVSDEAAGKAEAGKPTLVFFWGKFHKPGYRYVTPPLSSAHSPALSIACSMLCVETLLRERERGASGRHPLAAQMP
jgi:hypothetical protein